MGPSTGALVWPWWGRSLPKGNQWEAGTLDWGPMWSGSQSTCHLQCTPYTHQWPQCLLTPQHPLFSYTPAGLNTYTPCQHPMHPWTPPDGPNSSDGSLMPPDTPCTPRSSWCHLYPCWLLSTYTPSQLPNAPLRPPTSPDDPSTPWHP